MDTIPAEEFPEGQLGRAGIWVVAFLADWCGFCRRFRPKFETLDGPGPFRIAVADVSDEESPLWDLFGIEVVPAVVVFREGRAVYHEQSDLGMGLRDGVLERIRAAATSTPK
jgi:thioredoxin